MKHLLYSLTLQKVRFTWILIMLVVGLGLSLSTTQPAYAATITVNSAADILANDGVCTLREAIINANNDAATWPNCLAGSGADIIDFNSSLNGTQIDLLISGVSTEDNSLRGDLDITDIDGLTINGSGVTNTVINASLLSPRERVLDIRGTSGAVVINNLTIKGGYSPGTDFDNELTWGGGILNRATLTLNQVRLTGNTAGTRGGGIYFRIGTVQIINSLIDANTSGTSGGGIFADGQGATVNITLSNSTLSGNSAGDSGGGLAVYQPNATPTATVTLNYVTIAKNLANGNNNGSRGGGIVNIITSFGTLNILSTLIADNSVSAGGGGTGPDCAGTITSGNYNLVENTAGCTITDAGQDIFDPPAFTLPALVDNGGPTLTHALATDSPAIDLIPNATNGCGSSYTTDQRGLIRPNDGDGNSTGECEIGAYEVGEKKCSVSSGNNYTFISQSGMLIHVNSTGTNLSCIFVDEKPTNHPNATGVSAGIQTGKYWTIEGLQLDGVTPATEDFSINLTLPHSVSPDTNAYVCKFPGGLGGAGWDCARTTSTTGTVTRENISSLSDWAVGNNVGPTSLTLQTLTARSATFPIVISAGALAGIIILIFAWRKKTAPERQ